MRMFPVWLNRFLKRSKRSVVEKLEEIEEEMLSLESTRNNSLHLEKRLVFRLFFYAFIFFGMSFIFIYYFWPVTQSGKVIISLYIVAYPFIIGLLKWLLRGFFLRRIKKADERLKTLRTIKQRLLEEVMETEVFNKAQQILKRFDPLSFASLTAYPSTSNLTCQTPVLPTGHEVKNRKLHLAGGDTATPPTQMPHDAAPTTGRAPPPVSGTPQSAKQAEEKPRLLRPILPRHRSIVDRLVDAILGDGPDKRYALVCQKCASHNGMALKEEFEYLAFRCCYCSHYNPPRRLRQKAPVPPNIAGGGTYQLTSACFANDLSRSSPDLTALSPQTPKTLPSEDTSRSPVVHHSSTSSSSDLPLHEDATETASNSGTATEFDDSIIKIASASGQCVEPSGD